MGTRTSYGQGEEPVSRWPSNASLPVSGQAAHLTPNSAGQVEAEHVVEAHVAHPGHTPADVNHGAGLRVPEEEGVVPPACFGGPAAAFDVLHHHSRLQVDDVHLQNRIQRVMAQEGEFCIRHVPR